jgi:predicted glycogen debranching enzyme
MIAAGMLDESRDILVQFARLESEGTLPNMIRGDDASNRDTSDAPLWFFTACADLLRAEKDFGFLDVDCGGRDVRQVLVSIAEYYRDGTPNGICMDLESGLVFSPSHFTWMDTNHPAGSPREGYPIEIQVLWHAALELLSSVEPRGDWKVLAGRVAESIGRLYTGVGEGFLADCLHGTTGCSAYNAVADGVLRPNQLLAITLGAVKGQRLRQEIVKSCEELLVPGAIRSLANRPVDYPMPIHHEGRLLNDPNRPYWGNYSGDEDSRRKPAYHNGTAWTWLFPSYCEAFYATYGEQARSAALALLSSSIELVNAGCVGHVPEIVDGDAPHQQRGCGAQAWGASELYRVYKILK